MRDAGHRTAKKAKIIYPPPRGVDIIKGKLAIIKNETCKKKNLLRTHQRCLLLKLEMYCSGQSY